MRVISKRTLRQFWENHPDVQGQLEAWHSEVSRAEWKDWTAMKARFPSADAVGDNRYVFNIKGNHYRLVALIRFDFGLVFIKFVGTHHEYDQVDAREVGAK